MRLLNESDDQALRRIILYLTRSEAEEFRDAISDLLQDPKGKHSHIPSSDYQKEVTICIYSEDDVSGFDDRSKRLIINDE